MAVNENPHEFSPLETLKSGPIPTINIQIVSQNSRDRTAGKSMNSYFPYFLWYRHQIFLPIISAGQSAPDRCVANPANVKHDNNFLSCS